MKSSHYYRLLVFALSLLTAEAWAADFGDIPANLTLGAGTSVRRNAGNTLFEAYTPSSGTVTSIGLAGTSNQITVTGSTPITTSGSWTLSIPTAAQLNVAKLTNLTTNGFIKTSGSDGTLGVSAIVGGFTAHFSRGGASIQTNDVIVTPWTCPYSGTITGYSISADTGTCTLKTWKKANGTAIPTIADVISTSGVSLTTGTHIRSSTVSDFTTTTVTAGDMFMAQVTATSGPTDITFQVEITR